MWPRGKGGYGICRDVSVGCAYEEVKLHCFGAMLNLESDSISF